MLKLYTLTICYNEDTDEIEYIEECVDNPGNNIVKIGEHKLADYFTKEEITDMSSVEVGEA